MKIHQPRLQIAPPNIRGFFLYSVDYWSVSIFDLLTELLKSLAGDIPQTDELTVILVHLHLKGPTWSVGSKQKKTWRHLEGIKVQCCVQQRTWKFSEHVLKIQDFLKASRRYQNRNSQKRSTQYHLDRNCANLPL